MYSITNRFIRKFNSITEASEYMNIGNGNIKAVLLNRTNTAGGYIWKYC